MKRNEKPYRVLWTGPLEENCVLLPLGEILYIIDPGSDAELIVEAAKDYKYKKAVILLTHAHVDHISAVGKVADELSVKEVYLHPDDIFLYESRSNSLPPVMPAAMDLPDTVWPLHEPRIQVLHTPGHTPGGVVYYVSEIKTAFAGDTIFMNSIGRTDLPGGNEDELLDSIRTKIFTLPEDTTLICGHGPETTVGSEKRSNPYL